ncbi:hypothetical protein PsYK624_151540 [Phanerochaete sordida]|uniref:laccase n=1 Tax=Phanerochaete sordida TaxID=48140 RepID=A0A9P3GP04_9APHY|nr:hypothetical protein PsYK624_151540 [Phanerochaete sordida]
MVTEDSVQVVDLLISNLDNGDHPFHLHGHRPWIMGTGTGRYIGQASERNEPTSVRRPPFLPLPTLADPRCRRNTFLVPEYNWMVIHFITDNPGLWVFHCYLAWHMAAGLLMQINSLQAIISQCTATVGESE